MSSSTKIALPIDEVLLDPVKTIWQTPTTIPPMCKKVDKNIMCPLKTGTYYFLTLPQIYWLLTLLMNMAGNTMLK